jgi:polyisoprenyl-teichoic acid--peptidoglycan teichoic acid transferase
LENEYKSKNKISKFIKGVLIFTSAVSCIACYLIVFIVIKGISNPYRLFLDNSKKQTQQSVEETFSPIVKENEEQIEAIAAEPSKEEKRYTRLLSRLNDDADRSFMDGKVNVLLLGIDESRERADWNGFRTDTIMLLCIDFDNKKIDLISIPRDSLVWVHGYGGKARINTAFGQGGGYKKDGFEYLMETISKMTGGVQVDRYFCVDMEAFKKIVNAVGGVDYYVDVEISTSDAHIDVGQKHLWGYQVLAYCRQKVGSSDIARIGRQQRMIHAIIERIQEKKLIVFLPHIYNDVKDDVYTNLTIKQISALALFAMDFNIDDLTVHKVEGGYLDIAGVSLWGINQPKLEKLVKSVFGLDVSFGLSNDIKTLTAQADVLNSAVVNATNAQTNGDAMYVRRNKNLLTNAEFNNFIVASQKLMVARGKRSLTNPVKMAGTIKVAANSFLITSRNYRQLIEGRKAQGINPNATPSPSPTPLPSIAPPTSPPLPSVEPVEPDPPPVSSDDPPPADDTPPVIEPPPASSEEPPPA